jgi:xanthine dehydrogenase accessory factor
MESLDLNVLKTAADWHKDGHRVTLITVVQTWGSAPRPPGALLALRSDGMIAGSVSGGCVEDDLIHRTQQGELLSKPGLIVYGVSKEEATRFGLPCGGTLRLVQEPLQDIRWIDELLKRTFSHELVRRTLNLQSGVVTLSPGSRGDPLFFDELHLSVSFGPSWRLLLIGAGQLSQTLAQMAQTCGFEVLACDPRENYYATMQIPGAKWLAGMPDDVVLALGADAHTAIVALTHDPKLDDMALIEALKSPAFYVGALGSRRNTAVRKDRLKEFDLSQSQLDRLHGPVGLDIGSRTPAEIAVSILAEILAVKNGASFCIQKKSLKSFESTKQEDNLVLESSCINESLAPNSPRTLGFRG